MMGRGFLTRVKVNPSRQPPLIPFAIGDLRLAMGMTEDSQGLDSGQSLHSFLNWCQLNVRWGEVGLAVKIMI